LQDNKQATAETKVCMDGKRDHSNNSMVHKWFYSLMFISKSLIRKLLLLETYHEDKCLTATFLNTT
jgi:hypothetical protein